MVADNWQGATLAHIGSLVVEIETLRAALQQSEEARLKAQAELENKRGGRKRGPEVS